MRPLEPFFTEWHGKAVGNDRKAPAGPSESSLAGRTDALALTSTDGLPLYPYFVYFFFFFFFFPKLKASLPEKKTLVV